MPAGTLTGYAYLLDFDNAAANSTATYGVSFAGATKLSDTLKLTYRVELAQQSDSGSSALNYHVSYYDIEMGLAAKHGGLTLGHEVLGSDNNVGFKTPLATLHAFNGWADVFLTTPGVGLRDTFLKVSASLPGGISLLAFEHWYEAVDGLDLGSEFNAQLTRKFGKSVTGIVKYADYQNVNTVRKFWVQVEFVY